MWFPDELSLHQGGRKSTPHPRPGDKKLQQALQSVTGRVPPLERPCGKRNNYPDLSAPMAGQAPRR
jgi:hypothetical protein